MGEELRLTVARRRDLRERNQARHACFGVRHDAAQARRRRRRRDRTRIEPERLAKLTQRRARRVTDAIGRLARLRQRQQRERQREPGDEPRRIVGRLLAEDAKRIRHALTRTVVAGMKRGQPATNESIERGAVRGRQTPSNVEFAPDVTAQTPLDQAHLLPERTESRWSARERFDLRRKRVGDQRRAFGRSGCAFEEPQCVGRPRVLRGNALGELERTLGRANETQ